MRSVSALCALFLLLIGLAAPALAAPGPLVLELVGPINPVSAHYVVHGLKEAKKRGAPLVVLQLDTPGGLDASMREIVQAILASRVRVVTYVAPTGARAASAGMFVVLASHVAAMAPNTVIGAAHPVGGGGEEIKGPMAEKVTNDAAAYARSLAAQRGRDARWAEQAVRKSVSLSADEARQRKVVELVARDLPDLLKQLKASGEPQFLPMSRIEQLLLAIGNPAIALLLLNIGVLGIVFELQNPGAVLPGVVGVICLLLGCYALGMLPVSGTGVALLLFGLALLAAEPFVPSYGALAVGGVAALVLGSLLLFQPDAGGLMPPTWLVFCISAGGGALILAAVGLGLQAQRRRAFVGADSLVGRTAVVREGGMVFLEGELWQARTADGARVEPGTEVTVERLEGLTLRVTPRR